MRKLDKNFQLERFNLHVRLVNEDDAQYIIKLRTDTKLGMFLNPTQNDLEAQKQWIREYKERETLGQDYYFIYSYNGVHVGVNRIYNIKNKSATSGSWICSPNLPFEIPILTVVIIREIFFELLKLEIDYFDTRKDNKKVIRLHDIQGAHKMGESDIDVFHYLTIEDYNKNKTKLLSYIGLTIQKEV